MPNNTKQRQSQSEPKSFLRPYETSSWHFSKQELSRTACPYLGSMTIILRMKTISSELPPPLWTEGVHLCHKMVKNRIFVQVLLR